MPVEMPDPLFFIGGLYKIPVFLCIMYVCIYMVWDVFGPIGIISAIVLGFLLFYYQKKKIDRMMWNA